MRAVFLVLAFVASCGDAGYVLRCESDGEIVYRRDIQPEPGHAYGRHISERDAQGRIVGLCGYVHRVPRSMPVM